MEVCDIDLAKSLINSLNNIKIENAKKGLILEFSIEDIRKKIKRDKNLVDRKKKVDDERKKDKKVKKKIKEEMKVDILANNTPKVKADSIDTIKEIPKLMEIYHSTVSRGKKQRIKKRIAKLGFNPESLDFTQKNKNSAFAKKSVDEPKVNNYVAKKVDIIPRNKVNKNRNEERPLLNQKRGRGSNSVVKVN